MGYVVRDSLMVVETSALTIEHAAFGRRKADNWHTFEWEFLPAKMNGNVYPNVSYSKCIFSKALYPNYLKLA